MQTTGGSLSRSTNGEIVEEGQTDHVITVENSGVGLLGDMLRTLVDRRGELTATTSEATIFRIPYSLARIDLKAQIPEIVSIGPYHHSENELSEFEEHKWSFLHTLVSRTDAQGVLLNAYLDAIKMSERKARDSYAEIIPMSSDEFVKMLMLDGCFVVELLRSANDVDHPLIFIKPWMIPILIRDLLKLENQLPFFVLQLLFSMSRNQQGTGPGSDPLTFLALKFFNYALPRPIEKLKSSSMEEPKHLLDLFHSTFLSLNKPRSDLKPKVYCPSTQSVQSVTLLKDSGIKFKPRKSESLLDIKFRSRSGVLEIPQITINDFTSTIFINCIALEQRYRIYSESGRFSSYIAFMSCLVVSSRDVTFLCADGIFTKYSRGDQQVAWLFNDLRKNIDIDVRECYLFEQFRKVEEYYSGHWATILRNYFYSPWSFISVLSAFILIALTVIQTIMAIMSYKGHS